jgi:UDP-N-acetylglucosamine acyltransferase
MVESGYEKMSKEIEQHQSMNDIHPSFKFGKNLKMGSYNVIMKDVEVGDNVEICHHTLLKPGTVIGDNCYVDSYVLSSGNCTIGNNVIMRYQTVIARNVIIEDYNFFTAGVKLIFLDHSAIATPKPLHIKKGCFFGDAAVIMGGITIAENCIIGACAFVNKDTESNGVYAGLPAKRFRDVRDDELWWKK